MKHKVNKIYLEQLDFELLIIQFPEKTLEDKLAYFAKEKGRISKDYYTDYILSICVANINQLLKKLNSALFDEENAFDVEELREQIIEKILEFNPALDYNNIVINENFVLKFKDNSDGIPLVENKYWNNKGEELQEDTQKTKLKDVRDLQYYERKVWWKRIGKYVKVRKYSKEDLASLLHNRSFQNRTSFATFVVTLCVIDFEELFQLLDNMGIPSRVAPPLLMHELYEMCIEVNPFLEFDLVKKYIEKKNPNPEKNSGCDSKCNNKKVASTGSINEYVKGTEEQKLFKDVPKEDLLSLATSMKVSLIGQDEAVDTLVEAIQRACVGLKDPQKPIGSFLFAGKTGTGKTLATKVLADELIKDRDNLVVIDCSEYSADHEYSKLIGSPPGYIMSDQGGILTNAVAKHPFSVVVFDEIEKASDKVYQLLLQVLEEGRLTDSKGNVVSFKDTVIILTSNIGVDEIEKTKKTIGFGNAAVLTEEKKASSIKKALKEKFKPEFLNRLDKIIFFKDLTTEDYYRIIDIELYKLNENLQTNDTEYKTLSLEFDTSVKELIFKEGVDEEFGARPIKRAIERLIATPLAVKLLSGKVAKDSLVKIQVKNNKPIFTFEKKTQEPPFYMVNEGEVDADS